MEQEIKELALTAAITEARLLLDELRERQRSTMLLMDTYMEQLKWTVNHMRALAVLYEDVLKRMPDAPWLESRLTALFGAIIRQDLERQIAGKEGDGKQGIREMFT